MNIRRVKWSYLNVKKQKLEWKEELKYSNDTIEVISDPPKPKQLEKLLKDIFGDDDI